MFNLNMKTTIVVDTKIITEYLKTGKGILPAVYEKYSMIISAASLSELLASKTFQDSSLEKEVREFVDKYFIVKDIDKKIAFEAAKLIREYEMNLASAYIAATSLVEGHKLLTEDMKTFKDIKGLEFMSV